MRNPLRAAALGLLTAACTEPAYRPVAESADSDESPDRRPRDGGRGTRVADGATDARVRRGDASASEDAAARGRGEEDAALRGGDSGTAEEESDADDAGDAARGQDGDDPSGSTPVEGSCDLAGWWAIRNDLELTWDAIAFQGVLTLVQAGSGRATVWARMNLLEPERDTASLVNLCGAELPEFAASNALFGTERYGFYIPDRAWEQQTMPSWPLLWSPECTSPGCAIASRPLVATLGAEQLVFSDGMEMTVSTRDQMLVAIDHDFDGEDALTIRTRLPSDRDAMGNPYSLVPLSLTDPTRTSRVLAAVTFAAQFNAKVVNCDELSGETTQTRIEVRPAGCYYHQRGMLSDPEMKCGEAQLRFIDENLPVIKIRSNKFVMKRIAVGSTCAETRAALPRN